MTSTRAAFVSALGAALAACATAACYDACRFTFCPAPPEEGYLIGNPDTPFTTAICDKTGAVAIGHVGQTREARVVLPPGSVPISKWTPDGLHQPYTPSFFKSYGLNESVYGGFLSGVGHETPQQNQADYLDGQCFYLQLGSYQVLDKPGGFVIDNVHVGEDQDDECVAFTTKLPMSPVVSEPGKSTESPTVTSQISQTKFTASLQPRPETTKEAPETFTSVPVAPPEPRKRPTYETTVSPATKSTTEYLPGESPVTKMPEADGPRSSEAPSKSEQSTMPYSGTEPATDAPEPRDNGYERPAPPTPDSGSYSTVKPETENRGHDYSTVTPATEKSDSHSTTENEAPGTEAGYGGSVNATAGPPTSAPYVSVTTKAPSSTSLSNATPPAIDSLPETDCPNGCPLKSVLKPAYEGCVKQLNGRPKGDYWVFAALNGETSAGKSCGTASQEGKQLCTGTFQNVEWCNAGFKCKSAEKYRPEIVQCVAKDGSLCKLSSEQLEDVILERVEDGSDFFISCRH